MFIGLSFNGFCFSTGLLHTGQFRRCFRYSWYSASQDRYDGTASMISYSFHPFSQRWNRYGFAWTIPCWSIIVLYSGFGTWYLSGVLAQSSIHNPLRGIFCPNPSVSRNLFYRLKKYSLWYSYEVRFFLPGPGMLVFLFSGPSLEARRCFLSLLRHIKFLHSRSFHSPHIPEHSLSQSDSCPFSSSVRKSTSSSGFLDGWTNKSANGLALLIEWSI